MWLIKSLKWGIVILKFPSMIFAQRAIYVRALGSCWTDLSLLKKNWATWTSPWYPAQTLAREGGSSCACQGILFFDFWCLAAEILKTFETKLTWNLRGWRIFHWFCISLLGTSPLTKYIRTKHNCMMTIWHWFDTRRLLTGWGSVPQRFWKKHSS